MGAIFRTLAAATLVSACQVNVPYEPYAQLKQRHTYPGHRYCKEVIEQAPTERYTWLAIGSGILGVASFAAALGIDSGTELTDSQKASLERAGEPVPDDPTFIQRKGQLIFGVTGTVLGALSVYFFARGRAAGTLEETSGNALSVQNDEERFRQCVQARADFIHEQSEAARALSDQLNSTSEKLDAAMKESKRQAAAAKESADAASGAEAAADGSAKTASEQAESARTSSDKAAAAATEADAKLATIKANSKEALAELEKTRNYREAAAIQVVLVNAFREAAANQDEIFLGDVYKIEDSAKVKSLATVEDVKQAVEAARQRLVERRNRQGARTESDSPKAGQ
ncbi:MAG: hypothetical protein H6718_07765 [Polyangiaceae bacterium]|nr:hypothetical protein [Myxococcales bacterium]MCB9585278.1 hypothetical protein [Polyangiaceae bacterium]MCB9606706.1 hypothetical protein [Polyangiaceae bacterium]